MGNGQPQAMLGAPADGGTFGLVTASSEDDQHVRINYQDIPGPWVYHVHGALIDGKPAITALAVSPRDPDNPTPITLQAVRTAPIGTLFDRVKSALRAPWEHRVEHMATQVRTHRPKEGRSRPAEHFMQVAWFYLQAQRTNVAPRKAIAQHWGVRPVTASRWLAETRRRGYLPPYPGRVSLGEPDRATFSDPADQLSTTAELELAIFLKVLKRLCGAADMRIRDAATVLATVVAAQKDVAP
jgi:hypothetical protein